MSTHNIAYSCDKHAPGVALARAEALRAVDHRLHDGGGEGLSGVANAERNDLCVGVLLDVLRAPLGDLQARFGWVSALSRVIWTHTHALAIGCSEPVRAASVRTSGKR